MLSGFMAGIMMCVTSCLSSDETEVTMYEDAAVTNFYITSADVEYHTLSSKGEDSTYVKANTDVANIKFLIDHYQGKIYNVEPLPYGTNAEKLLCSYSTKNNGTLGLKTLKENEDGTTASGDSDDDYVWKYVLTTDSVDFSYPRTVRVYAYTDHEAYREYTITVNVKKDNSNSHVWEKNDDVALPLWMTTEGAVGYGCEMAVLADGNVSYTNADGDVEINAAANIKKLLAVNPRELYALSGDDRLMVSLDHGATWTEDVIEDRNLLPSQAMTAMSVARNGMSGVYHTVMIADPKNDTDMLETWTKISLGENADRWICTEPGANSLPKLDAVTIAAANSSVFYATGVENGKFEYIYVSRDGGLTWKKNSDYNIPIGMSDSQWLRLHATGDGQLVAVSDNGTWVLTL